MTSIDRQVEREKKLDKRERLEQKQFMADLNDTFGHPAGRRVLHRMLSMCEIYSDSFTGNSGTFYREGKRAIGLQYIEMVGSELYIKMLIEAKGDLA